MKYLTESLDHWHAEASRLNDELEKATEARRAAQIQLEQYQKRQAASGLCIDAALRGESRSNEDYWDGLCDAVRELAGDMQWWFQEAERRLDELNQANRELKALRANRLTEKSREHFVAQIKAQAVTDAMEYALDQVGSDGSADDFVDAMCSHLESLSEGKFSTVGSTGNTWRSIKAQGAREALQAVRYNQGFSDTVVRVDELLAVIADMEKGDE